MGDASNRRPVHPVRSLTILLAVAALLAGCAGPSPSSQAGPSPTPVSTSPSASPGASPGVTPSPRPDGWARVDLPDLPQVATLEPVTAGTGAVATDTTFRLRSLDGRPPTELAARLVAEPELTFTVESVQGDTAILRPTSPLAARTSYRISLARADGTTEASWVAQAAGPLQVTDTVPGNASTKVPRTTGIEVTFDQFGVTTADLSRFFTIQPAVEGRFEAAGRTIAFVPAQPLAKGRLYTVTIRHGLPLAGTGEVLGDDHVFRFETAAKAASPVTAWFPRALEEASTVERPVISISFDVPEGRSAPRTIAISVDRIASLAAAEAAWRSIVDAPEWTRVSTVEPVPTAGLGRVLSASVRTRLPEDSDTGWFEVPQRLGAGWYVVTERWAGVPRQTLLQVSDIATFAMVSTDRTAVWTNDLRTGTTATGAAVTLAGTELGRTDDRGLLEASTPAALTGEDPDPHAMLEVRYHGQTAFHPVGTSGSCAGCGYVDAYAGEGGYEDDWGVGGSWADDDWWRLLFTDRAQYRSTDTVNAWGMARNRDTGSVPASVTLAVRSGGGATTEQPPIVSATATPDRNGAFAARLELRDLPLGSYWLDVDADGKTIGGTWFDVATISKPAWRLELDTSRHALIAGGSVTALVDARFFEGTPVAGTRIVVSDETERTHALRTDALGEAAVKLRIPRGFCEQQCTDEIDASATLPEEADIWASTYVTVFASSAYVDADATVSGTRLQITGKVSDVVLSRFERPGVDPWEVDPRGAGRAGAHVALSVIEEWTVPVKVGTRYDPVTKQVVPVYEDDYRTRTIADRTVTTAKDGAYRLRLDVHGGRRSYRVTASYVDEAGRTTSTETWGSDSTTDEEDWHGEEALLVNAGSHPDLDEYAVGETVRVRFHGVVAASAVDRYLYAISQRGLRYVTMGTTPTFRTTFDAASLPSIWITGVRFNGKGYETAVSGYLASAALDGQQLTVSVAPDRDRYSPGDTASISIRTVGPDGSPVAASVYVGVVDEKLYAIGAAYDIDPLGELYATVGDGLLAVVTSHPGPMVDWGGGADTGGGDGGERSDFRDWLLAKLVTTDARGRASVQVPLSDDLTSWRVSASAVDGSLRAGSGTGHLEVGLPFFAEATIQPEYLAVDRPIIRVRGFGTGLGAGDRVTFTVSSDTLPMAPVTVSAKPFEAAEVPLPALSAGVHTIRIAARAGSGRTDTLIRSFRVVTSRTSRLDTTWAPLSAATDVEPGANVAFTDLLLVDAGRGRVIPALYDLVRAEGNRADQALASGLANRVLADSFGMDPVAPVDETGLDSFNRLEAGLTLIAYGSVRLDVTALAAMAGDPRLDPGGLRSALEKTAFDDKARRDRRLLALAGLAGLGDPVLGEVRAAAEQPDLTIEEQVSLALAALFAGDEALAGRLGRSLLEAHGLAYGPWLRLDAGGGDADVVQTARLAIVAASLGDPLAADMDAWLVENPPVATLVDLERALAARGWAQRVAGADAVAAVTVDGTRREVAIRAGEPASLRLTRAQAATTRIEPVSGSVLVVTSREVPVRAADLNKPAGVTMTRSISPAGHIGSTDRVVVTIRVTLDKAARKDPWRVVDWAPSGLAPVGGDRWRETGTQWTIGPDSIAGQRVEFSIGGNPKVGTWTLRYIARVVTPGVYRWEGSVLQAAVSPDHGLILPARTVTIDGMGG